MPLISVIIPVYNGENTIRETIESVVNQTFTDFEIIVINDGSEDSTLDVVLSIQDHRLKVFSYTNAGLSSSRNRGIFNACSQFITFLDADDLWKPDKLMMQLKALQEDTQAAIAYSWTDYIDESSHFLRPGKHISVNGNVYEKLLLTNFLESGSNALVRAEALTKVGGFDESLTAAEDWDMWLRLAIHYHFIAVPYPDVLYRQISANSISSNIIRQETECLKVIERFFSQAPKSLQHLKKHSIANLYEYLTFKAIEGVPTRNKGITSAQCLLQAIINNPSILRRTRIMAILLFKITIATLIPTRLAKTLLVTAKGLYRDFKAISWLTL